MEKLSIAKKVGTVGKGVGAVRDVGAAPRGKGQMNPQNESMIGMGAMNVKKVGSAVGGAAKAVGGAVKDVAKTAPRNLLLM